ncbi:unnamed protein product [Angiostrongylus costaricensis]|uniref:C2H2-type domain-containing protein n=1 Tax=Angiostrongylus costaricensis TaxID=334426 RepID=A0A0R3PSJ8_ANGCS|nr:unnamed protein product [Angiostrongylus costaricensis]
MMHGELLQFSSLEVLNAAPKMKCDECPKRFHSFLSLQRHMLMDHDTAMRGVCKNYFAGKSAMLCGYCGEYEGNIIEHLLESHGKHIAISFKQAVCPICDDMFEQKNLTFDEHLVLNCKWAEPSDEEI